MPPTGGLLVTFIFKRVVCPGLARVYQCEASALHNVGCHAPLGETTPSPTQRQHVGCHAPLGGDYTITDATAVINCRATSAVTRPLGELHHDRRNGSTSAVTRPLGKLHRHRRNGSNQLPRPTFVTVHLLCAVTGRSCALLFKKETASPANVHGGRLTMLVLVGALAALSRTAEQFAVH